MQSNDSRKITTADLKRAIGRLKCMKFFPAADAEMIAALMEELLHICHDAARLFWLVSRAVALYPEWCGVAELRALYSDLWTPSDGVKAWSSTFPPRPGGGFPSHPIESIPGYKALPAPEMKLLDAPRGEPVSQDPAAVALVQAVADKLAMPKSPRFFVKDATYHKLLDMGFLPPDGSQ